MTIISRRVFLVGSAAALAVAMSPVRAPVSSASLAPQFSRRLVRSMTLSVPNGSTIKLKGLLSGDNAYSFADGCKLHWNMEPGSELLITPEDVLKMIVAPDKGGAVLSMAYVAEDDELYRESFHWRNGVAIPSAVEPLKHGSALYHRG